jgi:DNA repair protein RecN (Recombination protein N)
VIKHLVLNNLVLVDTCQIHFASSFNAVTGETGAGKTALIEAIGLSLGERADTALIRKGCDKAYIEICFDIESLPKIKELLEESGLSCESGEDLVIRREISKEGKNRAFVNCRMTPLPLLQKIGAELIDRISQHAHQALRTAESQRALLDLFGELGGDVKIFQLAYAQEKELREKSEQLQQLSLRKERDQEIWGSQLEEIKSANLKAGEEEAAFEQYQKLANAQELMEKIDLMLKGLSEGALPQTSKCIKLCDSLLSYDKSLSDAASLLHESHIALTEANRFLQSYSQNLESNPATFQHLENRLSLISKLKRKYGQTCEEIQAYADKIATELSTLENLSEEIEAVEGRLKTAKEETDKLAKHLSTKRKVAAERLATALTKELQELNMSGAELTIELSEAARGSFGDDTIQFWLKANTGEHPGRVKDHASGGELSRLLFAIKVLLAEKNNTPTLIFDEIDANVGGKTATIIGEKLAELGKHRQVICITHFPQVASKANTHFAVQKIESDGRTLTQIEQLSKQSRELELLRMLGGKQLPLGA